jgi:TonB family protein
MVFGILVLAVSMQPPASASTASGAGCVPGIESSSLEQCRGDVEASAAQAAPKGSAEQRKHWEAAAEHYRRAVDSTASDAIKARLLSEIADLYDASRLNDPPQLEQTLRELIQYAGSDLQATFRLARVEEERGLIDEAEYTLLSARRQQPDGSEPYKMLAQFYARRATALQQILVEKTNAAKNPTAPGQRDADGFYRVGGEVAPPRKFGNAAYPAEAQAAGIQGNVVVEIALNEQGVITDATVVRSVPLLDESALKAVREWRYDPVIVNGNAVPAKMTVTVNFTLRQ